MSRGTSGKSGFRKTAGESEGCEAGVKGVAGKGSLACDKGGAVGMSSGGWMRWRGEVGRRTLWDSVIARTGRGRGGSGRNRLWDAVRQGLVHDDCLSGGVPPCSAGRGVWEPSGKEEGAGGREGTADGGMRRQAA